MPIDPSMSKCIWCDAQIPKGMPIKKTDSTKVKLELAAWLLLPLWLPFVYISLVFVEAQFIKLGILSSLGILLLFATPVAGTFLVFSAPSIPFIIRLVLAPVYYLVGLFFTAMIGWALGCQLGVVACH